MISSVIGGLRERRSIISWSGVALYYVTHKSLYHHEPELAMIFTLIHTALDEHI